MGRKRYSEFVYDCIQNLKQKQEASKRREENKKKYIKKIVEKEHTPSK